MPAIDTTAAFQTTVASTFAAGVFATGDSGVVRNNAPTSKPVLLELFSDHVTTPLPWRVRSPALADNVQGIRVYAGATPSGMLLPRGYLQPLQPQDTLVVELSTAAATGKAEGCLSIYYPQLPGISARLASPGDILGNIANIKPMVVQFGSGANTAGQWLDLVFTTTETLLVGNTDYAVLGYLTDVGVAALGIKGTDTSNLRICGPGVIDSHLTSEYFIRLSERCALPLIPVFNSANVGGMFASMISSAATAAVLNCVLILAEMTHAVPV